MARPLLNTARVRSWPFLIFMVTGCTSTGRYLIDAKVLTELEHAGEPVERPSARIRVIGDATVSVRWIPTDGAYVGESSIAGERVPFHEIADPTVDADTPEELDRIAAKVVRQRRLSRASVPALRESDGAKVQIRGATIVNRIAEVRGAVSVETRASNRWLAASVTLTVVGAALLVGGLAAYFAPSQPQSCDGTSCLTWWDLPSAIAAGLGGGGILASTILAGVGLSRHPEEIP
jgi:hypothetical protein